MQDYAHQARGEGNRAGTGYDPERDGFDMTWARSADAHELSAHGRTVQRRFEAPAPRPVRPSPLKRLRFTVYRLFHGR